MSTPPRVTLTERDEAVRRIRSRREHRGDPSAELIPDSDTAGVLDYLHKHRSASAHVRRADALDGLVLDTWCWWEAQRRRYRLLTAGAAAGLTLRQLGEPRGITTRAGSQDSIDRLAAVLEHDVPDEKITRRERRQDRARDCRDRWIASHRQEIVGTARALLDQAVKHEIPDRAFLDELADDLNADDLTAPSLHVLGVAASELRTVPSVLDLPARHTVHRTLARVDRLRQNFAELRPVPRSSSTRA